jgi:site-specific recombinase XerD
MLVIKLKGPANLGNLQGPFEASIQNRHTWSTYADNVDKMVKYFGPDTLPDNIQRFQVEEFRQELAEKYAAATVKAIISACSCFYTWMIHMEFANENPFREYRKGFKEYLDVKVIA